MSMHKITRLWCTAVVTMICAHASAQIVVIANPSGTPPSRAQVEELYLGRNFDYKPLDIAEQAGGLRNDFYKKLANRDPAQIKALWARIVFTGKGQSPLQLPEVSAIKKAVATDPKAIGYIDKSAADASVKVLFSLE